tara:strand:+ start:109 stop:633 length:525 start_codon:yes stop_codon:yes gene_type:complete
MNILTNKNNSKEFILYNNILSLSRKKLFYTKFDLADTFQNRINLIFFHISFIFIKVNQYKDKTIYKNFYQNLFDLMFYQIEINMREIGYGDITVNKNMKYLIKSFYKILLFCENYAGKNFDQKRSFFIHYLKYNLNNNTNKIDHLIKHFNDFQTFCFDLSADSVLKGEVKFNFN